MLKKLLAGIAIAVAVFVSVVALQPSDYTISRSTTIDAPASTVFPHVNSLRNWNAWSPWDKIDPNLTRTYEGPEAGVGAVYTWAGDQNVGEGKMTIVESRPDEQIRIKLEFFKPMAGVADAVFTFQPSGNQTAVTWAMSGKNNFMGKMMSLLMDMDKMIGGNFEQGLASLKQVAEAKP
jgi:hypothetical protein